MVRFLGKVLPRAFFRCGAPALPDHEHDFYGYQAGQYALRAVPSLHQLFEQLYEYVGELKLGPLR